MWSIDMYDEYGGYDVCVLMVVARLGEQNKFCFNWIEECAGAGAGHWRGTRGPGTISKQQIAASIIHTLTTELMVNTCHFSLCIPMD